MSLSNSELIMFSIERIALKGLSRDSLNRKEKIIRDLSSFRKISFVLMTPTDIESFCRIMRRKYRSNAYNRIIHTLKEFFSLLLDGGYIYDDPTRFCERVTEDRTPERTIFTEEEMSLLIDSIPETFDGKRDRAIIELLYSSGIRLSECVSLDCEDCDLSHHELFISAGKNLRERRAVFGERARIALFEYLPVREEYAGEENERALFIDSRGIRLTRKVVQHRIRYWKKRAGISTPGITHTIRHSCASHLFAGGAPVTVIQRVLGHETVRSTDRYTRVLSDDLKATYSSSHPRGRRIDHDTDY